MCFIVHFVCFVKYFFPSVTCRGEITQEVFDLFIQFITCLPLPPPQPPSPRPPHLHTQYGWHRDVNTIFSPDIILCGWLGSKHQPNKITLYIVFPCTNLSRVVIEPVSHILWWSPEFHVDSWFARSQTDVWQTSVSFRDSPFFGQKAYWFIWALSWPPWWSPLRSFSSHP